MIDEARGSSRSGSAPRPQSYSRPPVRRRGLSSRRSTPAERERPKPMATRPPVQRGAGHYPTVHHQQHRAPLDSRNHASPCQCRHSTCERIAAGIGRCPLLDYWCQASALEQVRALPYAGWPASPVQPDWTRSDRCRPSRLAPAGQVSRGLSERCHRSVPELGLPCCLERFQWRVTRPTRGLARLRFGSVACRGLERSTSGSRHRVPASAAM